MPSPPVNALRVALPVPLPRAFDYLPPPGTAPRDDWIGRRVRVPFGRGGQQMVGIVVERVAVDAELKQIVECLDDAPVLAGELLATLRWAAGYYHAPIGEVLALALPGPLRAGQPLPETVRHGWRRTAAGDAAAVTPARDGRPRRLLLALPAANGARGPYDETVLDTAEPGWRPAMRALAGRGLVERVAAAGPAEADPPAGRRWCWCRRSA